MSASTVVYKWPEGWGLPSVSPASVQVEVLLCLRTQSSDRQALSSIILLLSTLGALEGGH